MSAESEFLSFRCIKEAYAAIRDDAAMLLPVRSARRLFLRDHLGRFGRAFGGRLVRAAAPGLCLQCAALRRTPDDPRVAGPSARV